MEVEQCQNQFASMKSAREREMRYVRVCNSEDCRNPHLRKGSVQPTQKVKLINEAVWSHTLLGFYVLVTFLED